MAIHRLPHDGSGPRPDTWDLDERAVAELPRIEDYGREVADLRADGLALQQIPVADLLSFFDGLADDWLTTRADAWRALGSTGFGFAAAFFRRSNLERLLRAALRGDERALDGFVDLPGLGHRVTACPRGLVTHWLAGSAPVLGLLSIAQAALAKNVSVAKVSRTSGRLLPLVWGWVREAHGGDARARAVGRAVAESVRFVYCASDDVEAQAALSRASDVRVAWGGAEAVEAVSTLPRRPGTEDLFFGPKVSLAVLGRHSLDDEVLARTADALAFDVSVDDQRGCHSPHVVFVENGGPVDAGRFAAALAAALERALARVPKPPVAPADAFRVASVRAAWTLDATVHASRGPAWTVISSETAGLEDRCGGRVVFVRPVADVMDVLPLVGPGQQTIGVLVDPARESAFALGAAARGVARLTRPGQMARFDYPWDGVFPIDRFVRWVALD